MTRVAVVTGAAGGIGRAICARLRDEQWSVVGLDLRASPSSESELFRVADVGDRETLETALADVAEVHGVVSNAGVMLDTSLSRPTGSDWETVVAVNLSATFHLLNVLSERLIAARGSVVVISSVHALATTPNAAGYAAAKAGLLGLVRGAAVELGPAGVRVNAILPGAIDTPMLPRDAPGMHSLISRTPLGRIGQPGEIAEAAAFLLDQKRSGFITGQQLVVDGGALARLSTE